MNSSRREAGTPDRPRRLPSVRANAAHLSRLTRWELIARAEYYGADPATLRELHGLEQRRYAGLTDIIDAINRFHCKPTERYGSDTAQSQRRVLI